jgi:hypothetical protein
MTDLSAEESEQEQSPKKAAGQILKDEIEKELDALARPALPLVESALSGGLDAGFNLFTQSNERMCVDARNKFEDHALRGKDAKASRGERGSYHLDDRRTELRRGLDFHHGGHAAEH